MFLCHIFLLCVRLEALCSTRQKLMNPAASLSFFSFLFFFTLNKKKWIFLSELIDRFLLLRMTVEVFSPVSKYSLEVLFRQDFQSVSAFFTPLFKEHFIAQNKEKPARDSL